MFDRLLKLISDEELNILKSSTILIVGIGGVGGYSCETLARMGIGNIIIVDNDTVNETNINRQIVALNSTMNQYKVDVMENRIKDINPNCNVIKLNTFINKDNIDILDKYNVDYVIDACDTISTKLLLIEKYQDKIIACMGTGNRFNPTKLQITDIWKTNYDPLSKVIREELRKKKYKNKLPVVFSCEKPIKTGDRIVGSTSLVPSVAGIYLSYYVINKLLNIENKK